MMNRMKTLLLLLTAFWSALTVAHPGHGDHSALLAQGQMHPMLSTEHVLLLSAMMLVVYFVLKQIRK